MIRLVNETTNADGDVLHMPFEGAWTDQPQWYRDAVRITKNERAKNSAEQIKKSQDKAKVKTAQRKRK